MCFVGASSGHWFLLCFVDASSGHWFLLRFVDASSGHMFLLCFVDASAGYVLLSCFKNGVTVENSNSKLVNFIFSDSQTSAVYHVCSFCYLMPCGLGDQNSANVCPCACRKRRLIKGYKLSYTTGLLYAWPSCMQ